LQGLATAAALGGLQHLRVIGREEGALLPLMTGLGTGGSA